LISIDRILEKEQEYLRQLAPIRAIVLRFGNQKGWHSQRRGRKAHVSITGPANSLTGIIDIQIERLDWHDMPDSLTPEYPFTLWCSAEQTIEGVRFFSRRQLYWQAQFDELPLYVERFLKTAWKMLMELTAADLLPDWPGPAANADFPPNFGPPHETTLAVPTHC
jgi:hypothetical protein